MFSPFEICFAKILSWILRLYFIFFASDHTCRQNRSRRVVSLSKHLLNLVSDRLFVLVDFNLQFHQILTVVEVVETLAGHGQHGVKFASETWIAFLSSR